MHATSVTPRQRWRKPPEPWMDLPYDFGKYELRRELGAGAFARVYLAWHRALRAYRVLKILRPEIREDPVLRERFNSEAQVMAAMQHENIVRVTDMDEWDGEVYIAMEYVEGEDLEKWIDRNGLPPIEVSLLMLCDICRGLGAAHTRTIHRDIKPANMMFASDGVVKLMDFGLARRIEDVSTGMTQVGTVMGTPAYMSPEQEMGETLDRRTDIFSVGVVAYRLLTGDRPFPGASASEIRRSLRTREPRPLREFNPLVPVDVAEAIHHMLVKDRERRCQRIEDAGTVFDSALLRWGISQGRELLREYSHGPADVTGRLDESRVERHLSEGLRLVELGPGHFLAAKDEFESVLAMRRNHRVASEHLKRIVRELEAARREGRELAPAAESDHTLVLPDGGDDAGAPTAGEAGTPRGTLEARVAAGRDEAPRWLGIPRAAAIALVLAVVAGGALAVVRPWQQRPAPGTSPAPAETGGGTDRTARAPASETPATVPPQNAPAETPAKPRPGEETQGAPSATETKPAIRPVPKPVPKPAESGQESGANPAAPLPAVPPPATDGPLTGTLIVDLKPDVAVYVDDDRVSITGYKRLSLPPGTHTVRASYRDFEFRRDVLVEAGKTARVQYDLVLASTGSVRLVLASAEGWGSVVVDGVKRHEQAPGVVEGLPPGRHTIAVDGPQYQLDGPAITVDVVAGQTVDVPIRLKRK